MTMRRTKLLESQSFWKSLANHSRSSGCVGGSAWVPDSSSDLLSPRPKKIFHTRFAATRAVSGLSADTVHFARSSRVGLPLGFAIFGKNSGVAADTTGPELS